MEMSKSARFYNIVGVFFFVLSLIIYIITNSFKVMVIGFFALCLFWIIALQADLYNEKERIKNDRCKRNNER